MNTQVNEPAFPKWTACSAEAFPSHQSTSANHHPQSVQVLPYLEEEGYLNFISGLGELEMLGKDVTLGDLMANGPLELFP